MLGQRLAPQSAEKTRILDTFPFLFINRPGEIAQRTPRRTCTGGSAHGPRLMSHRPCQNMIRPEAAHKYHKLRYFFAPPRGVESEGGKSGGRLEPQRRFGGKERGRLEPQRALS